jgi:ribonuclease HII
VVRDRAMARLAVRYPGYGWQSNVGYATAEHRAALLRLGLTPHHRPTFGAVRQFRLALVAKPAAVDVVLAPPACPAYRSH